MILGPSLPFDDFFLAVAGFLTEPLEGVVFGIMRGGLLDILEHPNKERYPNQRLFIVNMDDYAYIIPFVEDDDRVFLKTIIPSRKMTRKYLRAENN